MAIDRDTTLDWMTRFAGEMAEHRQELVRLDTAIGDGDHGTNMNRGMQKALEKLQSQRAGAAASLREAERLRDADETDEAREEFAAALLANVGLGDARTGLEESVEKESCLDAVEEMTDEHWDRVNGVNVRAMFRLCREAIPALKARAKEKGRARIVNTASVMAFDTDYGLAAYCASKGAVLALTRQAGVQYASHNIQINSVSPGTTMTGIQRDVTDAQAADPVRDRHGIDVGLGDPVVHGADDWPYAWRMDHLQLFLAVDFLHQSSGRRDHVVSGAAFRRGPSLYKQA